MAEKKTDPVNTLIRWVDGETGEVTFESFDITVYEDGSVDFSN